MPLRSAAFPVLLAALLSCAPAWAGDPATAEVSPAEAYAAKAASLPAPAAEHGFRFDGVLRVNGKNVGHATLFAQPDPKDKTVWRVGDQIVIKHGAQPRVEIAGAYFTRHLGLLRGMVESNKPGEAPITWVKTETGFRGTAKETKGEVTTEQVRNFEHAGTATTTLAGTVLFARFALPDKAKYATTIFEVENGMKGKQVFHAATLDVVGEAELNGQKVLLVRARKGEQRLELLFRPEGKELVAVRFEEGEQRIEMLKGDMWSMPARDPVTASLRAALAFGTGNVELLDDVIYWPRFYKSVMAARTAKEPPTMDALRKSLLAQWKQKLPKNPPETIKAVLPQIKPQLKRTELPDGNVEVLFPPIFQNLKLTLGRAYGFWHMVALPGVAAKQPAPAPEAPKKEAPKKDEPKEGESGGG